MAALASPPDKSHAQWQPATYLQVGVAPTPILKIAMLCKMRVMSNQVFNVMMIVGVKRDGISVQVAVV